MWKGPRELLLIDYLELKKELLVEQQITPKYRNEPYYKRVDNLEQQICEILEELTEEELRSIVKMGLNIYEE